MSKPPFSPARSLNMAVARAGLTRSADRVFFADPSLKAIAVRYVRYVTPYVEAQGRGLVEWGIKDALHEYLRHGGEGGVEALRAYIAALMRQSGALSRLRMSVKTKENDWQIWDYQEPLHDFMALHCRKTLQVRQREEHHAVAPIQLRMLTSICTVRDLVRAEFSQTLFAVDIEA